MRSRINSSSQKLLDQQRKKLESALQSGKTAHRPTNVNRAMKHASHSLVHWLTNGSMPQVTKEYQGEIELWKVYDPLTKKTLYFDHESALRTWMDQRYYR